MNVYCNVVVVRHGTIEENRLFAGEDREVVASKAETAFLDFCNTYLSNFDEYD
ncbi:unnamed protein product, partial [marine sediment metagenome]